jgi:DNA mismatch endonuclease (patch repair protein)
MALRLPNYQTVKSSLKQDGKRIINVKDQEQDTKPEMTVRRFVWKAGFRYRLHSKSLPGTPDLVFKSKRKVIFVNGCFWHGHI